ncbi:Receptor-like serine/threonine-protein kinase SD1-7, partial [Geodia barretti]
INTCVLFSAPFSAQSSFVGVEVSTTDKARSKAMKLVQVKEINNKFVPVSAFPQSKSAAIANSDDATQPMYHPFVSLMSPPVSSFQYQSGTGTDSSRSSSLATGSSYNPDSAIGSPGPTPPSSRPQGNSGEGDCSYLPNTTVEPTGVSLGEGAYGEVCEVSYKGNIYAAKKYKISKKEELINLHKRLKAFVQEVQIPLLISHPNIVPYCGVCRLKGDGDNPVIVMERMDKNLTEYLKEGLITLDKKFRVLLHVAKGLQHLHQQKPAIIHRDLTANNVLLKNGVAKIGDFGNSRIVDLKTSEPLTTRPGTIDYMPPEAMEGGLYNEKLDIFSYSHLAIHVIIQTYPLPKNPTFYDGATLVPRTEVKRLFEWW